MYTIRPEQSTDLTEINEVNDLAFKGQNESKLINLIRESKNFIPELSLVAVTDRVIGHILFSRISIDTENESVPTLGLAPMAVHPDFQNQGIGSALVREGLKKCDELGFEHVVVLGHPNFYPRFGFVPSKSKGITSPYDVPDEVFMVKELRHQALANTSGKVAYPSAFDVV